MKDTFNHKNLRLQLVEVVRGKGITNENVLTALGKIPSICLWTQSFWTMLIKIKVLSHNSVGSVCFFEFYDRLSERPEV